MITVQPLEGGALNHSYQYDQTVSPSFSVFLAKTTTQRTHPRALLYQGVE